MRYFLESEKEHQVKYKLNSPYFSKEAKGAGFYKGLTRPFCLPLDRADENLYPGIRSSIKTYFEKHEIKWHDGQNHNPSNHLCDSQVCCANFLFPFADQPDALVSLLRPIFPELKRMLPIEDGQYVGFEWIGKKNYLGEKISRNRKRTRGANFTSADAAVLFELQDGRRQACLIEWKYTEAYYRTWLKYAASGTDKTKIYEHLYDAEDCPLNRTLIPYIDSLFYEPFYQLMRQQFLAHEMEKAHELEGRYCQFVTHIASTQPGFRSCDLTGIKNNRDHGHTRMEKIGKVTRKVYRGIYRKYLWQFRCRASSRNGRVVEVHYREICLGNRVSLVAS